MPSIPHFTLTDRFTYLTVVSDMLMRAAQHSGVTLDATVVLALRPGRRV